jgi:hypothetical protein
MRHRRLIVVRPPGQHSTGLGQRLLRAGQGQWKQAVDIARD